MEVYGNDISGILIIKKISETTHRVVLTSDFGNKMIDFEISENDFKLNYVCLLYTSPSPRDLSTSRMPSSA